MDPAWMNENISNSTICNFFYVFYVVYAILFVMALLSTVGSLFYMKKLGFSGVALAIQGLLMSGVAATMMLFFYLMCDRSLITKTIKQAIEGGGE
jgi:hypothetical protein